MYLIKKFNNVDKPHCLTFLVNVHKDEEKPFLGATPGNISNKLII